MGLEPNLKGRHRIGARMAWGRAQIVMSLLWLAFLYFWILPLLAPRGEFFWGHYQLRDLILGIPVGLATLCGTVIMLSPARARPDVGRRLAAICVVGPMCVVALDLFNAVAIQKIWPANVWY